MKINYLHTLCIAVLACLCSTDKATKPNVILILADDMGYGDICAINTSAKVVTPTLDRMANN